MFKKLLSMFRSKPIAKGKHGAITAHYADKLKKLKVGNTLFVDVGSFNIDTMRSSISSYTVKNWGRGAAHTTIIRTSNQVKVVRIS